MKEFRNVSDHADDLEDGRVIGVGETFELDDEKLKSEFNRSKIDQGAFLEISSEDREKMDNAANAGPSHDELLARAKELDIKGRTNMRNDELQTAIIAAEEQEGGSD